MIVQSRLDVDGRLARGGGDGPRLAAGQVLFDDHAADHRSGDAVGLAARLHPVARRCRDHQPDHGPGTTTLPIYIWGKVKLGVTPDINALATIIVVVVGIGVAIAGVLIIAPKSSASAISRWPLRRTSRSGFALPIFVIPALVAGIPSFRYFDVRMQGGMDCRDKPGNDNSGGFASPFAGGRGDTPHPAAFGVHPCNSSSANLV